MTDRSMLDEAGVQFYRTFGYAVIRDALSQAEFATLQREFEQAMATQYAGRPPFDGTRRHNAVMMDEDTPFFAGLLEDPRFHDTARTLYGDVLGVCVDANRYVGDTPWHTDSHSPHQFGIKFAIYLPPVDATSGALRVIPGSHLLFPFPEDFTRGVQSLPIQAVPCAVLDSRPGDVVAFDLRLWHGSFGGAADRRMCTVVYYNDPVTQDQIDVLRERGQQNVGALAYAGSPRSFLYSRNWIANPHGSPLRARWLRRLGEVGYLGAPGLVEGSGQPDLQTSR